MMPYLARGVIHIEALTAVAAIGGIPLVQDTARILAGNAIDTRELSVRCVDVPVSQPEIELPVFRCVAGTCGGGSRCREDQKNCKCGAKKGESSLRNLTNQASQPRTERAVRLNE